MKHYAIICTRDASNISKTAWDLVNYYSSGGFQVEVISGATSIFEAYANKVTDLDPDPEDVLIFCHDDIQISEGAEYLKERLGERLSEEEKHLVRGRAQLHFRGRHRTLEHGSGTNVWQRVDDSGRREITDS